MNGNGLRLGCVCGKCVLRHADDTLNGDFFRRDFRLWKAARSVDISWLDFGRCQLDRFLGSDLMLFGYGMLSAVRYRRSYGLLNLSSR